MQPTTPGKQQGAKRDTLTDALLGKNRCDTVDNRVWPRQETDEGCETHPGPWLPGFLSTCSRARSLGSDRLKLGELSVHAAFTSWWSWSISLSTASWHIKTWKPCTDEASDVRPTTPLAPCGTPPGVSSRRRALAQPTRGKSRSQRSLHRSPTGTPRSPRSPRSSRSTCLLQRVPRPARECPSFCR